MRILVEVPDEDLKALKAVTKKLSISRAEFVRRAIASSLAPHRYKMSHAGFGAWARHPEDGLLYQGRIRSEW